MHMTKKPGIGLGRHLAPIIFSGHVGLVQIAGGIRLGRVMLGIEGRGAVPSSASLDTVFKLYYSPTVMKIQSALNSVHVQNANHMSLMVISSLRLILLIQRAQLCLFFPPSTSRTPQTSKGA